VAATLALAPTLFSFGQDARQPRRETAARQEPATVSPLDQPIELAQKAREKYRTIHDYSCILIKRERIDGQLQPMEFIQMKMRNRPFSVYMKWQQPYEGREAIYVDGQYGGKLMVHSTGLEKTVAGTVALDPRGEMAMENSRHAITEAGLGNLINQLCTRWESERKLGKTQVELKDLKVDGRSCVCVKTLHPNEPRNFTYYRARVFFDKETSLPIRFEAYDWPRRGGAADGDLVEEYTYRDLKFNISLTANDFNTENPAYNFGRL
jgi:hypothetical protein